jgi:hypothetical protein
MTDVAPAPGALTTTTRLDEILIRFAADGTPAAHQRTITEIKDAAGNIVGGSYATVALDPAAIAGHVAAGHAQLLALNQRLLAFLTPAQRKALEL